METQNEYQTGAAQARLLFGRLLCILGVVLVPFGAYFISVATEFVVLCLGIVGYYLGARYFGIATVVLAVTGAFLGLLWGQGYIPNLFRDDGGEGIWGLFDGS